LPEHARGDLLPERCVNNLAIKNMMHGNRIRRHRPPGIDQQCSTLLGYPPQAIVTKNDILPTYFADIVRAVAAGIKIDDANSG
jgi:hypothetical protein